MWAVVLIGVGYYTAHYLHDPALPGAQALQPLGWWGWFDQSVTLRSTAALAAGNLDSSQHHYPLGYSVLALPFYWAGADFSFFTVDLVSLLAAFVGFVGFARRLALPRALAALLFVLALAGDRIFLRQWIVPWNTIPVGACFWLLLANCAAWLDGRPRPFVIGVLLGVIVACRPLDAILTLPCLATLAWTERRAAWAALRPLGRLLAGAAVVLTPLAFLHLAIYGFAPSLYMRSSAQIGFTLHDFAWKAYVLWVDPYPWFADGEGLLQRAHWIALGLAGLAPALLRGPKDRMLAGVLVLHGVLYTSYVDLLPTGLWRFLNIHYFAWAIPGYALLAALLVRDLAGKRWPRGVAVAAIIGTAALLCVRVVPRAVSADEPAKAVDFAGPMPPFVDTFLMGALAVRDANGVLHDYSDFRGLIYPGGVRVIGIRRELTGPVEWVPGSAPQGFERTIPDARWAESIRLAWPPRWIRRAPRPAIPVPLS